MKEPNGVTSLSNCRPRTKCIDIKASEYGASIVGQNEMPGMTYPIPKTNEVIFFSPSDNHNKDAAMMIHGQIGCKNKAPIGPRKPGGEKPTLANEPNSIAFGRICIKAMTNPGPIKAIFFTDCMS